MQYQTSRIVAGPALRLWARPVVTGARRIPESGGAILASNHLSVVDTIYLPLMLERPVTFTAKSEYFTATRLRDRIVGAYLRGTHQLPVDRTGARAGQAMLDTALELLRRGGLFGMYPEGTRSPDGRLYRGRTGVGWLALESGVPVIPVAMVGTDKVLAPGSRLPRPGRIEIRIGEPMTFGQYAGQPPARQRRAVTDEIVQAIGKLSGQEYVPMYASARKEQLAAGRAATARAGPGSARVSAPSSAPRPQGQLAAGRLRHSPGGPAFGSALRAEFRAPPAPAAAQGP